MEQYSAGGISVRNAGSVSESNGGILRTMGMGEMSFDEPLQERGIAPSTPLGTKYGETVTSRITRVMFKQKTDQPEQIVTIYYDSLENLEVRGIVEVIEQLAHNPDPFPEEPAVDPGYAQPPPK